MRLAQRAVLCLLSKPIRAQRLSASMRLARIKTRPPVIVAEGAQRLSASMRLAQRSAFAIAKYHELCSTPFGIYEVGTVKDTGEPAESDQVLNAFRHL